MTKAETERPTQIFLKRDWLFLALQNPMNRACRKCGHIFTDKENTWEQIRDATLRRFCPLCGLGVELTVVIREC